MTDDQSSSLYSPLFDETYHSTHGALQESIHVFIEHGFLALGHKTQINILEMGYGTGLNAMLTAYYASKSGQRIHYIGVEKYPVPAEIYTQLRIANKGMTDILLEINSMPWEQNIFMDTCVFCKRSLDFLELEIRDEIDLVYYDAFSPNVQPELWSTAVFDMIYRAMSQNAILVTYCAKGQVRRNLQDAGFTVERLPGPIGKREMLRARKK